MADLTLPPWPETRRHPRRRGVARITARDRELLAFVAEHRLVLAAHVQALLGISAGGAYGRLRGLTKAGFLSHTPLFQGEPGCFQITRNGLGVIGSDLPRPRIDLRCYRHDVGAAWLWLAARSGVFGPMREVLAERQLRSHDGTEEGRASPLGVRLGGVGPGGRERLHYPDLILMGANGRRIALELELSSKGSTRREQILAGYAADARVDAVVYLVDDDRVGRKIQSSAARLGISPLIHVQPVRLGAAGGATSADVAAQRLRRAERPAGARPGAERPAGARPGAERPAGARPGAEWPAGARPEAERAAGARTEAPRHAGAPTAELER